MKIISYADDNFTAFFNKKTRYTRVVMADLEITESNNNMSYENTIIIILARTLIVLVRQHTQDNNFFYKDVFRSVFCLSCTSCEANWGLSSELLSNESPPPWQCGGDHLH